jgi:hypothetical protein
VAREATLIPGLVVIQQFSLWVTWASDHVCSNPDAKRAGSSDHAAILTLDK